MNRHMKAVVGPASKQSLSVSVLLARGEEDFSWIHYVVFGIVTGKKLDLYIMQYMHRISVTHCLAVGYDAVNLSSVHADQTEAVCKSFCLKCL